MPINQFAPEIPGFLEGDVTVLAVDAPANFPPPAIGNQVVDPKKAFTLKVEWEVFGAISALWVGGLGALGASWAVTAYAESIGAGPEKQIGSATVATGASAPSTVHPGGLKYTATVPVAAGALTEDLSTDESGMYKLAVSVFLNSSLPGGFDLTGYLEGPIIRVEDPE